MGYILSKQVIVFLEERFLRSTEGQCASATFNDAFWARYLSVYDRVHVVARIEPVSDFDLSGQHNVIENENVLFHPVPYYKGPIQFLWVVFPILLFMFRVSRISGASIIRLPGVIGGLAFIFLFFRRKKYGVELVGDPSGVFSAGGVGGKFSVVYRFIFYNITRAACRYASAVSYVTKNAMQQLYPPSKGAYTTNYSSIELPSELIVKEKSVRKYCNASPFTIFMVGSMEQKYKGFDVMINALGLLRSKGRHISLVIAGDGYYKRALEALVKQKDLDGVVVFLGQVSRLEVLSALDSADLFVMPSRTEGLPRALIEAMARGVPAIGSDVGGIPELLPKECIFPSENYVRLADIIDEVVGDHGRLLEMSRANLVAAQDYEIKALRIRQIGFYRFLASANGLS